jgi:hypothetical protein
MEQRQYRRRLIGRPRLLGWCDSCGFLVEARTDQEDALVARIDRHAACAHSFPAEPVAPAEPARRSSADRDVDRLARSVVGV